MGRWYVQGIVILSVQVKYNLVIVSYSQYLHILQFISIGKTHPQNTAALLGYIQGPNLPFRTALELFVMD